MSPLESCGTGVMILAGADFLDSLVGADFLATDLRLFLGMTFRGCFLISVSKVVKLPALTINVKES